MQQWKVCIGWSRLLNRCLLFCLLSFCSQTSTMSNIGTDFGLYSIPTLTAEHLSFTLKNRGIPYDSHVLFRLDPSLNHQRTWKALIERVWPWPDIIGLLSVILGYFLCFYWSYDLDGVFASKFLVVNPFIVIDSSSYLGISEQLPSYELLPSIFKQSVPTIQAPIHKLLLILRGHRDL